MILKLSLTLMLSKKSQGTETDYFQSGSPLKWKTESMRSVSLSMSYHVQWAVSR